MTSELQVRANQRNAHLSTGPKTEEGKRKVALNAVTHGLSAKPVVIQPEDAQAFEQMRQALLRAYKPVGDVEWLHADRAAVALWRLHRVLAVEGRLFLARQGVEEGETPADALRRELEMVSKGLPGLSRYEKELERAFNNALAHLRQEQAERAVREAKANGRYLRGMTYTPSPGPWAETAPVSSPTAPPPTQISSDSGALPK